MGEHTHTCTHTCTHTQNSEKDPRSLWQHIGFHSGQPTGWDLLAQSEENGTVAPAPLLPSASKTWGPGVRQATEAFLPVRLGALWTLKSILLGHCEAWHALALEDNPLLVWGAAVTKSRVGRASFAGNYRHGDTVAAVTENRNVRPRLHCPGVWGLWDGEHLRTSYVIILWAHPGAKQIFGDSPLGPQN